MSSARDVLSTLRCFQFAIFDFQWLNFRGHTLEMPKSRSPLVIIFITIFIDLVGFGIVIPVLPLYAERYGASEATVGVLLAIYSAMQFIFAPKNLRLSAAGITPP